MAAAEHLLALDLGTTSVRALVVGADGSVRAQASRPLATRFPRAGWVEQDPLEFAEASFEVLRTALAESGLAASDIAGLGVVTQRATVIAWDAATGDPLAPALGWQDARTSERSAELSALGLPVPTSASALKLEWWMRNEPAVSKAAASGSLRLGTPDAWLGWKLTGGAAHATDPGQASCTVLCDGHAREWADGLCEMFGVPRAALPEIAPTSGVVGETPKSLLGATLPVASRAGDQQASAFAQGVHRRGRAKLTLGTSAMLDLHCGDEPAPLDDGIFPLALWSLGEKHFAYCREGSVYTAGAAIDWLESIGVVKGAAELDRLARETPDAGGVVFVPALQGLGSPVLDSRATGLIGGITRGTGRGEIARAALEGIAQRCADVAEPLDIESGVLRVDGGLARSDTLLQCLADWSGLEVARSAELETTALGAALLAGLAVGVYASPADCEDRVGIEQRFSPSVGESERGAVRARWREAVERCR